MTMVSVRGQKITSGVYRFGIDRIDWSVIADGSRFTSIDAGLPGHWQQLVDGLHALEFRLSDIEAILLTHGDLVHIGFIEWLRLATDALVWIHPADIPRQIRYLAHSR